MQPVGFLADQSWEMIMSYSTLMVHLELEHPNDARLQIAGDLAEQFDSKVIGIAACDPQPGYYAYGAFAHGLVEQHRADVKQRMIETEERFRAAVQKRAREIEWRCAMAQPTEYVACEARAADLIITGSNRDGVLLDPMRQVDPSALVMQAGRPVFVVPPEAEYLKLSNVLVAWKDTREARRAVNDALPLLHRAKYVEVVEVVEGDADRSAAEARVNDVAAWLGRHAVTARGRTIHASREAERLDALWEDGADLVVAGAYGHTRLQEWVFGGVTRNLLTRSRRCSLLSH
jgi:nucleotide-binding universal stress UspA family protein